MRRIWPVAALAALTAVLFADVLFRGRVFYERDVFQLVYSQAESFVRCVAAGSWPVWDPALGFGQPMLANPGVQVLYPWTWLNLIVLPESYFTIYVTSHLLLSGVGFLAFGRRLGLDTPAALTGATVWMLSGPVLSLVSLWQHFAGVAWIPWVLLAADAAMAAPGLARALLWGLALAGQLLAGSLEMCLVAGLGQAAIALRHLSARGAARRRGPRLAAAAATAAAAALALSAGMWLPALSVLRASSRPELGASARTFWSLHPVSLLQTVLPVFPHQLPLQPEIRALLLEGREPFLGSIYLGVAALPLVAAALVGPHWRAAGLLAAAAAGAALVALGKFGVAYPLATALLPALRIFRYPSKAIVVAALCWALLAGLGYQAYRAPAPDQRRRWTLLVLVPAILATALVVAAAFFLWTGADAAAARFLLPPPPGLTPRAVLAPTVGKLVLTGALALGAVAAAGARIVTLRSAAVLAPLAALVAVVDLLLIHRPLNPTAPRELIFRRPAALSVIKPEGPTRIWVYDYLLQVLGRPPRDLVPPAPPAVESLPRELRTMLTTQDSLAPPGGQRWGLYGSYDYDWLSLYPRPLRNLTFFFRAEEGTAGFLRLLRLGGVSYVVALHTEGLSELGPPATVEGAAGPVHVFSVPDPLPRVFVVGGARVQDGLPALRTLVDPAFDPEREVIISEGGASAPSPRFAGEARLLSYQPDRIRSEARLSEPGFLVLPEAYDPGWRVTVDGRDAPLLRANVAFRAVALPAGTHVVEMRYRPRSVRVGVLVSALSLVAVLSVLARKTGLWSR